MILTESEARTKWCPFARSYLIYDKAPGDVVVIDGINRDYKGSPFWVGSGSPPRFTHCMASTCMAWTSATSTTGFCGLTNTVVSSSKLPF